MYVLGWGKNDDICAFSFSFSLLSRNSEVVVYKIDELQVGSMKANAEAPTGSMDGLKWSMVFLLLAAAVVGNSLYNELSVVFRTAGVIALVAVAMGVAAITAKGKAAITFARESRMEVRKVVWPTRQETLHTTFIVLVVTVVTSLILWGVDGVMVRLVRIITGV